MTAKGDPPSLRAVQGSEEKFLHWSETHEPSGEIRPAYRPLFQRLQTLPRQQIRALDERLEATMREMGVTFDISRDRPWGRRPWFCDSRAASDPARPVERRRAPRSLGLR